MFSAALRLIYCISYTGTAGHSAVKAFDQTLFSSNQNKWAVFLSIYYFFYYENSLSGGWLKGPPARVSITNIDKFHSRITSRGATDTRQSITMTQPSYRPPVVAPSNRIFPNVRRVRDGAGCLIMMEGTGYEPRNNAIIVCVISPHKEACGWEMECASCTLYHASLSLIMADLFQRPSCSLINEQLPFQWTSHFIYQFPSFTPFNGLVPFPPALKINKSSH